jgi:hypothetical protein
MEDAKADKQEAESKGIGCEMCPLDAAILKLIRLFRRK